MSTVTVLEKPACSTCRSLRELLAARGIEATLVDLHTAGLTAPRLRELLAKAGASPRDWIRMREPQVIELGLTDDGRTDDELIALMAAHPLTIQRPIVEVGDRAVLARPPERALTVLPG